MTSCFYPAQLLEVRIHHQAQRQLALVVETAAS